MKLVKLMVALGIVFALGGVFGLSIGNSSGWQAVAPQFAAKAESANSAPESAPAVAPEVAPVRVGVVGQLQAVGSQSLAVQTDSGLQLLTIDGQAGADQGLSAIDQLKVGDRVAVWAQQVNGQTIVTKVVVVPPKPERMHYVGLIANISGDRIDVVGQQGETTTFRVDEMMQVLPDASRRPQVGDTVTVVAKPDPRGDGWLAVALVRQ